MIGHSSGEIAAAFAAGALTLASSMRIAFHRGVLSEGLRNEQPTHAGAMLAVGESPTVAESLLRYVKVGKARIACYNSPSLVTISGDEAAVMEVQAAAEKAQIFARRMHVDVAYHSHHMLVLAKRYLSALQDLELGVEASAAFYSTLRAQRISIQDLGPEYWVENMTQQGNRKLLLY